MQQIISYSHIAPASNDRDDVMLAGMDQQYADLTEVLKTFLLNGAAHSVTKANRLFIMDRLDSYELLELLNCEKSNTFEKISAAEEYMLDHVFEDVRDCAEEGYNFSKAFNDMLKELGVQ